MSHSRPSSHHYKYSRYDRDDLSSDSEFGDSDSDSYEPPHPPQRTLASRDERRWREKRSFRPPCGLSAHQRLRSLEYNSLSTIHPNISSSFETTNDTNEDDLSDLYTPIDRKRTPPRRNHLKGLSMIEEISPVCADSLDDPLDDLPIIPSLKLQRDWKPQHTSTTTSLQALVSHRAPSSSRSHAVSSTPRSSIRRKIPMYNYSQVIEENMSRPTSYYADDISDITTDHTGSTRSLTSASVPSTFFKPENFGLPAVWATNMGSKGILFMTISKSRSRLIVQIKRAVYFINPCETQISSFVTAEMRQSRSRDSKRNGYTQSQKCRTRRVHTTNMPTFNHRFTFDLKRVSKGDSLFISVFAMDADNLQQIRTLGCMTFQMRRIFKKAEESIGHCIEDENTSPDSIVIKDGGFFLLPANKGELNNLPQSKVQSKNFYDDHVFSGSGLSGTHNSTTSCSSLHSSTKMRLEDYGRWSAMSSSVPGYSSSGDVRLLNNPHLDYTSASSSSHEYNRAHHHRATLPSITTTSENTSDGDIGFSTSPIPSRHIDMQYLYAADSRLQQPDRIPIHEDAIHKAIKPVKEATVRRAASFTFSPKGTLDKHNRRTQNDKERDDEHKKKFFGPISKTISYIRNKMDTALSTSSLYPSRDEVRQWENCFESLLNHKFGCALFRQFLKKEYSDENVDFWVECEEFKKMKDGKKSTILKAQEIYKEFIAEQAQRQVNLDSDTRAATKAAVENGCRTDTFSLAQSRIEQLMAKDSYRRFLKDALYTDLVKGLEDGGDESPRVGSMEK